MRRISVYSMGRRQNALTAPDSFKRVAKADGRQAFAPFLQVDLSQPK
jgi:hypothetical protein